jgi:trk system potassium uptake protein TrkH
MNFSIIIRFLGILLVIEGLFIFTALPFSYYYGSSDFNAILISGLITLAFGILFRLITKEADEKSIGKREGYVIVSFSWIVISIFGTLPFIISNSIPSFTDAFFETISGFSTTGASILTDIEIVPKGILFWRSMTHWIGGMGIIVLTVAILPFLGIGGMQLFNAESSGISTDKLHPRITETAKRLWGIYVLLTAILTVLLLLGGMNLFESLCHAFGTMGTGGFSPKNTSIGQYSPYIQYVCTVFMMLAATSFSLHYFLLKGKFKRVFKNEEFRLFLTIIFGSSLIIAGFLFFDNYNQYNDFEKAFRDSWFTVSSIVSCTGFVTADYMKWSPFLWFFIFLLMFSGGCAGSTTGGIKVIRHLLLLKNVSLEFKRLLHPSAVLPVRLDGKPVHQDIIFNVLAFFMMYIVIFAVSSFALSITGVNPVSSIGAVATCMAGIGPGLGDVGGPATNFSMVPLLGKWILSFMMLIGRLEIFTVFILFAPSFWKK